MKQIATPQEFLDAFKALDERERAGLFAAARRCCVGNCGFQEAEDLVNELVDGLAFHDEPACAGRGLDGDASELRRATLADLFGKNEWGSVVAVKVRGPSMEGEHIKDGDTVLVDARRTARDGDIVLVHLAGRGQLVKRLRLHGPFEVALESANSKFETIVVEDPAELRIHGVVVGRCGRV